MGGVRKHDRGSLPLLHAAVTDGRVAAVMKGRSGRAAHPNGRRPQHMSRLDDALALSALVATALVIALPTLRGGYLTYLDNPVHLAEIGELAEHGTNAWSEIGFAGIPLGTLHSPLWYALLALWSRAGAPVGPLYALLLVVSFVAPALALYAVARRRLSAWRACLLAYFLLVQSTMIWGIASPLGGMWTHALAAAGVVVLLELWSRERLTARGNLAAALLLALVALTHLFALVVSVLAIALSIWVHWRDKTVDRPELLRRAGGCAVAALASALYWLTFAMTSEPEAAPADVLTPSYLACRLLMPCDAMYLVDQRIERAVRWDLHLTDAVPMVALVAAGVAGFVRRRARQDTTGRVGFLLAVVLLVALLVHPYYPLSILGPVSWRLLYWVRLGLALSAVHFVAALPPVSPPAGRRPQTRPVSLTTLRRAAVCITAVGLGYWWGQPLRTDSPPSLAADVKEAQRLWDWLGRHADPSWGRLYVQDTFGHVWDEAGMSHSHLPALTIRYSKLPQLGAYYGVVPYRTRWTLGEFNTFFSEWFWNRDAMLISMEKTNVGAVVSATEPAREFFGTGRDFDELVAVGRYSVWRRRDAKNRWVAELRPTNRIENVEWARDRVRFRLTTEFPRGRVVVKNSWHRWWTLKGIPGASLQASPDGFLGIVNIPKGSFTVELRYEPSRLPLFVTAFGWTLFAFWAAMTAMSRSRSGAWIARALGPG